MSAVVAPAGGVLAAIRATVFWIWQILVTFVIGVPVLIAGLFSYDLAYPIAVLWIRANVYGLRVICGVSWVVEGRENIPDTPCIVLCKHQSTWETYFLAMLFHPVVYVAKRSLGRIPIFGWALHLLEFILIDRKAGRSAISQMVQQARDRLDKRRWVIIFPEGTRQAIDATPNYRIGGAIVAARTGYPILPVATNSGEFWPRMGFVKRPGTITVSVLPPIPSEGQEPTALIAETEARIEERMREIRRRGHEA